MNLRRIRRVATRKHSLLPNHRHILSSSTTSPFDTRHSPRPHALPMSTPACWPRRPSFLLSSANRGGWAGRAAARQEIDSLGREVVSGDEALDGGAPPGCCRRSSSTVPSQSGTSAKYDARAMT